MRKSIKTMKTKNYEYEFLFLKRSDIEYNMK